MLKQFLALRVLVVSFLLIVFPLLIYSFVFFNHAYDSAIKDAYKTLEEASLYRTFAMQEAAPVATTFLKELNYLLSLEKEIPKLPDPRWTLKLISLTSDIKSIDVYVLGKQEDDGRYKILASDTGKEIGDYFLSSTRLNIAVERGTVNFVRFFYSEELKQTTAYLYSALAIYDSSHNPIGFLLTRRNIATTIKSVLEVNQEGRQGINFAVVEHDGYVQAATDHTLEGQRFADISLERQRQLLQESNRLGIDFFADKPLAISTLEPGSRFFEFKWQGKMQLAALTPYPDIGDAVLAYSSKGEVFGKAIQRFLVIYIIFACVLLGGALLTYFLAQWISRPLVQLTGLMKKVREGRLDVRFHPSKFGFEINALGLSFNKTLSSLLENMQKAEDERVKKEIYRKEIEIGRQVQEGLLPQKMPEAPGVELYAAYFCFETKTGITGGDFYDIFVMKDNLYLICADAVGMGISTCFYSLNVRSLLRAYTTLYPDDVGRIMALSNNAFCEDTGDSGMFVTAIMGIFDLKTRVLSCYSCGHVLGIIRKKNGEIIHLNKRGMALGLMPTVGYEGMFLQLESEDLLLFYTDGLSEALNEKHQMFSEKRIEDLLRKRPWFSAQEVVEGLKEEVKLFIGSVIPDEQVTLVAMKII